MATAVVLASAAAFAQGDYPARPMRLVVPFAPGGGADISARTIAQKLTERFGQQVVVDNRPGAGGNIGTELVLKAPPDGYTLLLVSSSYGANPALYNLGFDPVTAFEPITLVSQQPFILAINLGSACQKRQGPHRVREGQSGQAELSLLGHGRHTASRDRALQEHGRRRHRPRSVQGRQLGPERSPGGTGAHGVRHGALDDAHRQEWPVARARGHDAHALARCSRSADAGRGRRAADIT